MENKQEYKCGIPFWLILVLVGCFGAIAILIASLFISAYELHLARELVIESAKAYLNNSC